jgi:hypothetical protein
MAGKSFIGTAAGPGSPSGVAAVSRTPQYLLPWHHTPASTPSSSRAHPSHFRAACPHHMNKAPLKMTECNPLQALHRIHACTHTHTMMPHTHTHPPADNTALLPCVARPKPRIARMQHDATHINHQSITRRMHAQEIDAVRTDAAHMQDDVACTRHALLARAPSQGHAYTIEVMTMQDDVLLSCTQEPRTCTPSHSPRMHRQTTPCSWCQSCAHTQVSRQCHITCMCGASQALHRMHTHLVLLSPEETNITCQLNMEMLSLGHAIGPGEKDSGEEQRNFSVLLMEEWMAPVTLRRLNRVGYRAGTSWF